MRLYLLINIMIAAIVCINFYAIMHNSLDSVEVSDSKILGLFEINTNRFYEKKDVSIEFARARDIYNSLYQHRFTNHKQKEILSIILSTMQQLATRSQALEHIKYEIPRITYYRNTTDLTKTRIYANTSLWYVLGKLCKAYNESIEDIIKIFCNTLSMLEKSYKSHTVDISKYCVVTTTEKLFEQEQKKHSYANKENKSIITVNSSRSKKPTPKRIKIDPAQMVITAFFAKE